jgi:protein arginine kinase activator
VHVTDIIDGKKKEVHLCQACAEQQHLVQEEQPNLSAILQLVIGQNVGPVPDELARLACPVCGIKYMEFRAGGRLGCPHDYQVFRHALDPLLVRIHRGTRHLGKVPRHAVRNAARQAEIVQLRQHLRAAVEAEAYEEAARLRDVLRHKEATDESGQPDSYRW